MKWERDCEEMTMCVTKGRELAGSGMAALEFGVAEADILHGVP
jgi:hypothetical protein